MPDHAERAREINLIRSALYLAHDHLLRNHDEGSGPMVAMKRAIDALAAVERDTAAAAKDGPRDAVIEAVREWRNARLALSNEHPRTLQSNRRVTTAQQTLDRALAALDAADTQARGEKWRHKKRGTTYEMVGTAEVQVTDCILEGHFVVVYRAEDGKLWVRPTEEFYDGRFERAPLPEPAPREDET